MSLCVHIYLCALQPNCRYQRTTFPRVGFLLPQVGRNLGLSGLAIRHSYPLNHSANLGYLLLTISDKYIITGDLEVGAALDNCKAERQRAEKARYLKDAIYAHWEYAVLFVFFSGAENRSMLTLGRMSFIKLRYV